MATVLATAAPAGADGGYRVRSGDTLLGVAARLGVDPAGLAAANGITDPNVLVVGRRLAVPAAITASSDPSSPSGSYLIRPGDTLSELALRLGVPQGRLATVNSLADPNRIFAGHSLLVPGRASAAHVLSPRPAAAAHVLSPRPAAAAHVDAPDRSDVVPVAVASPARAPAGPPLPASLWRCPVPGAHFVDDFGFVKPTGQVHEGVDLYAPRGTPVVAPVSGMVAEYPNDKGGRAIQLWGDDGNRYYGAHLDAYGRTGRVTAGTVIGRVGNSGDAKGGPTHLHFELHPGGGPAASPYPLLVRAC
jgi:murein DD-endopeptidase MepM/ murein hydrolase activator NlpD